MKKQFTYGGRIDKSDKGPYLSPYWLCAAIVGRMKTEILADIASGRVPSTIRTFAELHDHVDANEYGGLCDVRCPLKVDSQDDMDVINEAQDRINEWLQAGHEG